MLFHGVCRSCKLEQELLLETNETPVCSRCQSTDFDTKIDTFSAKTDSTRKGYDVKVGEYVEKVQPLLQERDSRKRALREGKDLPLEKTGVAEYKPLSKEKLKERKRVYRRFYSEK